MIFLTLVVGDHGDDDGGADEDRVWIKSWYHVILKVARQNL